MTKLDDDQFSDSEIELLTEALTLLRAERGRAWNAACDAAASAGKRRPSLKSFGIDNIVRLAQRFGIRRTHPSED